MNFLLTLGVLFVTFWSVYTGCLVWKKYQTNKAFEIKKQPVLAGAIYLGVFIPMSMVMLGKWACPLGLYTFLMGASLGLLYAAARWHNAMKYWLWGIPVLCGLGVIALTSLMPSSSFAWYEYIFYAFFWSVFMGFFVICDRVPCCSYLQSLIWGGSALLALLLTALIPSHVPLFFSVLGSILLVVMLGLGKVMIKWQMPTLGIYGTVLIGFLWGALFTFALMKHQILSVVLMLNNYIFALTFGMFLLWRLTRKMKISCVDFYQSLPSGVQASTLSSILKYCGFLSCLGVLFWTMGDVYPQLKNTQFYAGIGIIVLIFFLNLYNRIQDGGAPPPRVRDILSSAVQGIKVGFVSGKQEIKEMVALSEAKKESEFSQKKVTVSKSKKRVIKKKKTNRKK